MRPDKTAIEARVGTTLAGKYLLTRVLGSGGMGVVYEADHVLMQRRVAIKVMHDEVLDDVRAVRRFLQEGRAAARIKHPHIVAVLDVDQDPVDKTPYIALEHLAGTNLRQGYPSNFARAEHPSGVVGAPG